MKHLVDRLHKIAVTTLMGLTVFGAATFGMQLFTYFYTVKPSRIKLEGKADSSQSIEGILSNMSGFVHRSLIKLVERTRIAANIHCSHIASQQKTWNILHVNHVAVATKNLENSTKFYRDILGAKTSQPVPLPDHGVTTVFVEFSNTKFEILLPLGNKSPIENFLEKNPSGGMHHICLEVDNIENAVEDLKSKNIRMLGEKPKIGAHGKPVIFLHPKDCGGVLIELEQV